jgi:hypothetical protein
VCLPILVLFCDKTHDKKKRREGAKGGFIHNSYTLGVSIASTVVRRGKEKGRGHTWTSILF